MNREVEVLKKGYKATCGTDGVGENEDTGSWFEEEDGVKVKVL